MSFNLRVLLLVLIFIAGVSVATYYFNRKNLGDEIKAPDYKKGEVRLVDKAVEGAETVYQQQKNEGVDFSKGPCLTNDLMTDWVADIVHSPRQDIDNLPEYQCIAYVEGRAHHFVELDPFGNLIRVK
jgi:hypothetical protein